MRELTFGVMLDSGAIERGMFGAFGWRRKLAMAFFWIGTRILGCGLKTELS